MGRVRLNQTAIGGSRYGMYLPEPLERSRCATECARQVSESSRSARLLLSFEILAWSICVRMLLRTLSFDRVLRLLNRLPSRAAPGRRVELPQARMFSLAGACLGKSLARSQYLRRRGQPHTIAIGVRGGTGSFAAHAWIEGFEAEVDDFVVIRRVAR